MSHFVSFEQTKKLLGRDFVLIVNCYKQNKVVFFTMIVALIFVNFGVKYGALQSGWQMWDDAEKYG